jgi:hypothetical protein
MPGLREGLKTTRPSHWSWMAASGQHLPFRGAWVTGSFAPIPAVRPMSGTDGAGR